MRLPVTDSRNEPTRLQPIAVPCDETREVSIAGHRAAALLSHTEVGALQAPGERELHRLTAETDLRNAAAEIANALYKAACEGVDDVNGFRQALFLAALLALLDAGKLDAVEAVIRSLHADIDAADGALAMASPLSAILAVAVRAGISTTEAAEAASVAASSSAITDADVTRVLARIGPAHRVRLPPARGEHRATEDAVLTRIRIVRPRRRQRKQRGRTACWALLEADRIIRTLGNERRRAAAGKTVS